MPDSPWKDFAMKTLFAAAFAAVLMSATAASAGVGVGVHVGPIGVGAHLGGHHHYHHHCIRWSRHHPGVCRAWG